jgi:hypothetical protein
MDLEKLTRHKNYGFTVSVAVGLSIMMVAVAAMVGRGALNLKGEVVAEQVTVPVVIRLFADAHPDETIQDVEELPPRPEIVGSLFVVTTEMRPYMVRVTPVKPWTIVEEKSMHRE